MENIILNKEDSYVFIYLHYENIPTFCSNCHCIGHDFTECSFLGKKHEISASKSFTVNWSSKPVYIPKRHKGSRKVDFFGIYFY